MVVAVPPEGRPSGLENRPHSWAKAIAVRALLRIFPIAMRSVIPLDPNFVMTLMRSQLTAVGAISDSTLILVNSNDVLRAADAVILAQGDVGYTASRVASFAVRATRARYPAFPCEEAVRCAYDLINAANRKAYAEDENYRSPPDPVKFDQNVLLKGQSPDVLFFLPLWRDPPRWWHEDWSNTRKWLSASGVGFEILREWYHGRLEGLPHAFSGFDNFADEVFYRWIVEQENDWWSREPAEVNNEITEFVDSLRKPKDQPKTPVDFFISYAGEDEATARDIAKVLDELGKTYLVQYRDFPQSNFVNMMNEAMERAERLIPVYSKSYAASDFCKAEWNHYFKLDPSGAERCIVGFKLDGADLPPLMDQIVYEKLTGTPRGDWPEVIRKWVDWEPLVLTRENVDKTTTTILDPGVEKTAQEQLHTAPTAERNTPEIPAQLAEAMASLRMMLELVKLCQINMSGMMQGSLKLYEFYLEEGGDKPSWDGLDRYVAVLAEGSLSMSGAELREEKKALEEFIAAHNKCLDARKQAPYDERELAHVPLDGATSEAIEEFIEGLKAFRETALARDAVTREYDLQAENLIKQGRDFAFEAGALDAGEKPDTARKRFLRYVGGFAIKTLAILGSIASIRSSPEGSKLISAAERLVEKFYEMVGL